MIGSGIDAGSGTIRGVAVLGITGAALAMLGGCATQLQSVHLKEGATAPRAGVPYNLTFTQFNVTLERSISKCPEGTGMKDLEIASDFTFSSSEARDPAHEYALDMTSLRSFLKTTDVRVNYHPNGALATINASANDQTGTFITSVASTVGKVLVSSVAPAPLPEGTAVQATTTNSSAPANAPRSVSACSDEVVKALKQLPDQVAAVEKATRELNYATADWASVIRMVEASASRGREGWKPELNAALENFKAKREGLREAGDALKKTRALLAFEPKKVTWPLAGDKNASEGATFRDITDEELKASNKLTKDIVLPGRVGAQDYWLELRGLTAGFKGSEEMATGSSPTVEGIRYRKAMPGRLVVIACPAGVTREPPTNTKPSKCKDAATSTLQPITQLGPIFALPLKNYPFMSQNITAEFNDAGQPVKLGYFSEAAAGKISGTLDGVADQWLKVKEASKPKSELDTVNEQLALLQAQNQLAAAKQAQADASDPDQKATQAAKAKAALLEAQLAQLKAEKALLEAQRGAN